MRLVANYVQASKNVLGNKPLSSSKMTRKSNRKEMLFDSFTVDGSIFYLYLNGNQPENNNEKVRTSL